MTERITQTQKILEVLDDVKEQVSELRGDFKELKKQVELQPKLDAQSLSHHTESNKIEFEALKQRVVKVEDTLTWLGRTVIGQIIIIVLGAIAILVK